MAQPMHSHGPGQPMHSHGPPPQQQQPQQMPQADPDIVAAMDATFKPVTLKLGTPTNNAVVCETHGLDKCTECECDYTSLNQLAKLIAALPTEMSIPPPPQMAGPQLSQLVAKTKEEGNAHYKNKSMEKARDAYSLATTLSMSRRPWEPGQVTREEVAVNFSNRAAALSALGDHIGALVDATMVIGLKRPWPKGYLRKSKALAALGRLEEAQEAINLGLSFEPSNSELTTFGAEIASEIEKARLKELESLTPKPASSSVESLLT